MYTTPAGWDTLIAIEGHYFECCLKIGTVYYPQDQIVSMTTTRRSFSTDQPGVGGCLSGEIDVTMLMPAASIPRMAQLTPYVKVHAGAQSTDWLPQGVYFIDTRETTDNGDGLPVLRLHGYDAMLKAEASYPSVNHSWPIPDIQAVQEIAAAIGAAVDQRTVDLMTGAFPIGLPAGFSMRETLSQIACMYAGNFVIGYGGELLLVPINSYPVQTNYLVTAAGEDILFGGEAILV